MSLCVQFLQGEVFACVHPLENPLSSAEVSGASEICLPRPLFLISASTCRFGIITVDFSVYVSTHVPECMCQYEINGMGILAGLRRGENITPYVPHIPQSVSQTIQKRALRHSPPLSSLPSLILNCLNDQERKQSNHRPQLWTHPRAST